MGSDESSQHNNWFRNDILEHYKDYNNSINKTDYKIDCSVHSNEAMSEYIYELNVDISNEVPPEFIFIVDKSGSMGKFFIDIITKYIPDALNKLGYGEKKVHLITFDNDINYYSISNSELLKFNSQSAGQTYLSKSFYVLRNIFDITNGKCNHFRLLIISDGCLADQKDTKYSGEKFYEQYKNFFKINSQFIRLKTNSDDIEIEGMASVLQLNNVNFCNLIEHDIKDMNDLPNVIVKLFNEDGLNGNQLTITGDQNVQLKNEPWDNGCSNTLFLQKGKNIFFTNVKTPLFIDGKQIECKDGEEINSDNYELIVGNKRIKKMFQRLKMNNILDIDNLNRYYRELEHYGRYRGGRNENYSIREYFRNLSKKTKKIGEFDSNLDYLNEEIFIIFNGIGDKCSNFTNEKQKVNYIQDLSKIDRIFGYSNLQNKKEQKENESISELKNEINIKKKRKNWKQS